MIPFASREPGGLRPSRSFRRSRDPSRPPHLSGVPSLAWGPSRLRSIPLDAIVGTVDATEDFDASFRPASARVAARWQRVARAHRDGLPLPPIAVIERPDGYYVLDGRHRVSVARALGHGDIEAWTSRAVPARCPDVRRYAMSPRRCCGLHRDIGPGAQQWARCTYTSS